MEWRQPKRWELSAYEYGGSVWSFSSKVQRRHTTYFPGISTADDTWTKEELEAIGLNAKREARQQYAERQEKRFGRLAENSLDKENQKQYETRREEWKMQKELMTKPIAKAIDSGIISVSEAKEVADVHTVGKIDKEIYKCVTKDIVTDEVIITDNQIQHIKDRHPNDYERFASYFDEVQDQITYRLHINRILSAFNSKGNKKRKQNIKTVLRLVTSNDDPQYKNSIITFMKMSEKEWNRLIRDKNVLYRRE